VGEHEVRGLDVAVNDAGVMRVLEAPANLDRDVERVGDRQRTALQPLLQRLAVVIRHRDEQLSIVGLVDVVDRADVRVVEG
jgi:hypothetical protein